MATSLTDTKASVIKGVRRVKKGPVGKHDAAVMLEQTAALWKGDALPFEVTYEVIGAWLEALFAKSLDSQVLLPEARVEVSDQDISEGVRIARGVDVMLSASGKLTAVVLRPVRFEEGRRAMSVVGIGKGDNPDVAERHDDYLVDAYMNWNRPQPDGE